MSIQWEERGKRAVDLVVRKDLRKCRLSFGEADSCLFSVVFCPRIREFCRESTSFATRLSHRHLPLAAETLGDEHAPVPAHLVNQARAV